MARSKLAAEVLGVDDSTAFAGSPAGSRAPSGKQSTSLFLRPLLTPFKGRGRLFLRLEKLPQRATLSAGKRNSDGSWSLASDELDDVTYQVPPQAAGDHILTIRVTALEGGEATTLKVLDFPVSFRTPAPVANASGADQPGVASPLGHVQSLVALREAEMGLLHAQLEQEQRERARDATLMEQRLQSAFDQGFEQAVLRHQQTLEAERAALQAEIADLAARVPAPGEKERDAARIRQELQADFDQRLAQGLVKAAAQHQQELDAQRTALQSKIAELTARIPAQSEKDRDAEIIRQHLQKDFDQRLAKAALQHRQELEAERAVLRAEIAELTSRIPAQSEKDRDAEIIRQHLQKEFDQRLAGAALQHRQELEAERAALQAEITALSARADASERQLKEEQQSRQGAQQAAQAEAQSRQMEDIRRAAAAEAEENLRIARERWNADLIRAVPQAREDWSREQGAALETLQGGYERLLAGESDKIAALEAALAAVQGEDHNAAALASLSDQLAAAGQALADRERELEDAKAQLEKERAANGGQAEKVLQQERSDWKVQENSLREQLSSLQAQAEAQIVSLTARCREAEARTSRNNWGTAIKDKARIDALTLEVQSLRTALAKQASAPAQDRANGGFQTAASLEEPKQAGRSKKALVRDFCIAVCCITPLILFYPRMMSFVHDFMSDDPPVPIAAATPKAAPAALKARTATVVRGVNMRKTASAKADVVFTLKKGAAVEILSTAGKWTEVGVKGPGGAGARGWVYNTYLEADGTN